MSVSRGGALVTGGAKRIGRGLALAAADAGYAVVVHHRDSHDEARATVDFIRSAGGRATTIEGDLSDEAVLLGLVADAAYTLEPLTLLVNNASVFDDDRAETLTQASWDAHMTVNLRAPVALSQAFAAQLPEGAQGLIINILDQRVWKPTPQFFSYSLSKSALWAATRTLAQAFAPRIRVNGIGPGPTLPNAYQAETDFDAEAAGVLLQRRVDPQEIAAALRYLIDAPSVTGQMIAVDGGQHLGWLTPDVMLP